ncbi:MAG: rod shape-determining protein RodA [Candidatus Coatesbacteria bacterium]|nr:MAG: rod shape-determining protein RodA [Candidatus Coatesbacteria bacterium]
MNRRAIIRRVDLLLLVSVLLLAVIGVFAVGSATYDGTGVPAFARRQLGWVGLGVLAFIPAAAVPYRYILKVAPFLYAFAVVLLVLVLFTGSGARRWLAVGPFSFQPSEFAKVALILSLAGLLSYKRVTESLGGLLVPVVLAAVPALLVIAEPDLGTAVVFIPLLFGMLFAAGVSYTRLFILVSPFIALVLSFNIWLLGLFIAASAVVVYINRWRFGEKTLGFSAAGLCALIGFSAPFFWNMLKEYQKQRLLTFISPEVDPRGAGYSIIQAKIAVGSGQLFGKGYLDGTQVHLRFLPEPHTDFIYPVIAEEFGFVGSVFILVLFFVILYRAIAVCRDAGPGPGGVLAAGVFVYFLTHIVVNLGMAVGFLPVVGLPLPFLSYGGSITVASFVMVGLLVDIAYRSRTITRW